MNKSHSRILDVISHKTSSRDPVVVRRPSPVILVDTSVRSSELEYHSLGDKHPSFHPHQSGIEGLKLQNTVVLSNIASTSRLPLVYRW